MDGKYKSYLDKERDIKRLLQKFCGFVKRVYWSLEGNFGFEGFF